MLPPGHWRLKLQICRLFHANNMCPFDAEIKSYKHWKTIIIEYWPYTGTYNSKHCCYVCNCYYYDRAVHISVAVDVRTLLDRNHFSSSSNGQVAAHRVTGLIIKRLWRRIAERKFSKVYLSMMLQEVFMFMVLSWKCARPVMALHLKIVLYCRQI